MHVSLAACVSGLGRPGSAGDMLGTEFALRSLGVASVTASHWHVDLETASSFHAAFYRSWIVEGKKSGCGLAIGSLEFDGCLWSK
ncbi:CHAT domain-containing protein [Rhizobium beringeri]